MMKMKLSEAMREGYALMQKHGIEQGQGKFIQRRDDYSISHCCALGAAYIAVTTPHQRVSHFNESRRKEALSQGIYGSGHGFFVGVIYRNDLLRWNIEMIIDWLEKIGE